MGSDSGVWGRATPTVGRTDEAPGEADGVMEKDRGAGASAEKLNQSLQARVPPRYGQASTSVNSWVPRGPQAHLHACWYTDTQARDGAARQQIVQPGAPGAMGRPSQRLISHEARALPMREDLEEPRTAETLWGILRWHGMAKDTANRPIAQGVCFGASPAVQAP